MEQTQPLIYNPVQPKPQAPAAPTYELKKDVTGKPPPERGLQTITIVKYVKQDDGTETKETAELRVPHKPKANCKKCHGRGYIGFKANSIEVIPCLRCFPVRR